MFRIIRKIFTVGDECVEGHKVVSWRMKNNGEEGFKASPRGDI